MKKYEIIEHTADIGLLVYGQRIEEVFENAAEGLFSLMVDLTEVEETEDNLIEVKAGDLEELLVEWLNELIYQFEVNELLLKRFNIIHLDSENKKLEAKVYGEKLDLSRHQIEEQIKACTYHQLQIKKNQIWTARVIFDV